MKLAIAVPCVLAASAAQMSWDEYKAKYNLYFNGDDEDAASEAVYNTNVQTIETQNSMGNQYTLGVNQFTYLSTANFLSRFTGEASDGEEEVGDLPKLTRDVSGMALADSIDWSQDKSVVNPVKDQGSCGSCWAFGAVGSTEMSWAVSTGTLLNLAEQQVLDCDTTWNSGCQGGLSKYVWQSGGYYPRKGACSTQSYGDGAYHAVQGSCQDSSCVPEIPAGAVIGYVSIAINFNDLKANLMQQPVKVSVHADSIWQMYKSGIAQDSECYTGTNHAVIAVGYDGDSDIKIRNSWGPNWGEGGYIRVGTSTSCSSLPFYLQRFHFPTFASMGSLSV